MSSSSDNKNRQIHVHATHLESVEGVVVSDRDTVPFNTEVEPLSTQHVGQMDRLNCREKGDIVTQSWTRTHSLAIRYSMLVTPYWDD